MSKRQSTRQNVEKYRKTGGKERKNINERREVTREIIKIRLHMWDVRAN